MITDRNMRRQVIIVLDGREDEFKVDKIVDEIQARYGTVDINDVDPGEFWETVAKHVRGA